jgi:hypothetical protein
VGRSARMMTMMIPAAWPCRAVGWVGSPGWGGLMMGKFCKNVKTVRIGRGLALYMVYD